MPEEPRDPALSRYVYDAVERVRETLTARQIAKQTGVSTTTLSFLRKGRGRYGIGRDVAEKLLPVLGHKTYDELLIAAFQALSGEPSRFVSLERVLAKHPSRWSSAAAAAARSMRPAAEGDPGETFWVRTLDVLDPLVSALEAQASAKR